MRGNGKAHEKLTLRNPDAGRAAGLHEMKADDERVISSGKHGAPEELSP